MLREGCDSVADLPFLVVQRSFHHREVIFLAGSREDDKTFNLSPIFGFLVPDALFIIYKNTTLCLHLVHLMLS